MKRCNNSSSVIDDTFGIVGVTRCSFSVFDHAVGSIFWAKPSKTASFDSHRGYFFSYKYVLIL